MTPAPLFPATTGLSPTPTTPARAEAPEMVRTLVVTGGIGPDPAALATTLERDGDVLVVGATSDAAAGIELAQLLRPDVVLVDQLLGLASGTAVARHVLGDVRHAEIVLRTPWPDADRHDAERTGVYATVDVADPAAAIAAIEAAGRAGRRPECRRRRTGARRTGR